MDSHYLKIFTEFLASRKRFISLTLILFLIYILSFIIFNHVVVNEQRTDDALLREEGLWRCPFTLAYVTIPRYGGTRAVWRNAWSDAPQSTATKRPGIGKHHADPLAAGLLHTTVEDIHRSRMVRDVPVVSDPAPEPGGCQPVSR